MLIVFIAVVLLVGMAAFAIYQTSQQLQAQSKTSAEQTITEVSTGVKIVTIQGHNTSGAIDKIVMVITPQPGSLQVGLNRLTIEISDTATKCVLTFNASDLVDAVMGTRDVFSEAAFPSTGAEYGVIVLTDTDGSCSAAQPVINRGDNVMLAVNTTACFGGIGEGVTIIGDIIPESGAWGPIDFRTPTAFANPVIILA